MNREVNNIKNVERDSWGYVVCFGTAVTFIAGIGHVNSFGLIYNDFMKNTNSTTKSLTTAHGVFSIMLAIGGIILNITSKKMSLRKGGLIGALLFIAGSFLTVIITNTNQLPLTFGVLQGIGFGIMVPVSYSTLNYYFVRKRTTVMSLIKAIQGLVLISYPQILKMLIHEYGFRGTLLLISGISLHTLPGMLIMKTKVKQKDKRPANSKERAEDGHENIDLLNTNINEGLKEKQSNYIKMRKKIMEILNLESLKDPVYRNICIGQSFVNFSDLTFFILQPMLLFQYGYNTSQVATCISVCAGADVAGRCILAIISSIININTRILFYVSTLVTFVFRIVILQVQEFTWVITVTGVLGIMRAWIHITSPLVISSHVSHEDFPGAYALFMLTAGIVNMTCSPIIGLLKDVYDSYYPTFYVITCCCLPCLIIWPIEYKYKK